MAIVYSDKDSGCRLAGMLGFSLMGLLLMMVCFSAKASSATGVSVNNVRYTPPSHFFNRHPLSPTVKSYHPLYHRLASGIKVRGVKLADSLYLTRAKQANGHTGLGLSLASGVYLYQLGMERMSVSFRF